ncbi:MAG: 50S ribosomal protein L11 methyltransferase [Tissierellia bacterium]|nr:50S ribosomal protein L11 methyltransferase [Tissierellia bacterium]
MDYLQLDIRGLEGERNTLEGLLARHGIYVFEEVSTRALDEIRKSDISWDYLGEDLVATDEEHFILRIYYTEDVAEDYKPLLEDLAGKFELKKTVIPEADWANSWKEAFSPIAVNEKITVVPSWEDYSPREGETVLIMDPGMAFGSGTHNTTLLCMERLAEVVRAEDVVYDIGTGSGILGILAALLGAREVRGVDIDPLSITSARDNAERNGVSHIFTAAKGDLMRELPPGAHVVVSNLFAELIVSMLEDLDRVLLPGGTFIASGILTEKEAMVVEGLKSLGFEDITSESRGDWSVVQGVKP